MDDLEQSSTVSADQLEGPAKSSSSRRTRLAGWFAAAAASAILLMVLVGTRNQQQKEMQEGPSTNSPTLTPLASTITSKLQVESAAISSSAPAWAQANNTVPPKTCQEDLPFLNITDEKPLGVCQGHCKIDADCAEGLFCFGRAACHPVPGCLGGEDDASRTNYCVKPILPPVAYVNASTLGLCQGDYDNDSDCEGNLVCFQRDEFGEVPGCIGGDYDGSRTDYCVNASASLPPTPAPSTPLPPSIPPSSSTFQCAGIFGGK